MSDALLNLVRCEDLETTEGIDVESGSNTYTQHDEIKLAQPDGSPAALPGAPSWITSDVRYEYSGGGHGIAARRKRLQIPISIDYIGNDVHRKLQQWAHERALVWFNPGWGRYTDLAWRPLEGYGSRYPDGTTGLTDLTGRWPIATQNNSTNNYVWDADMRVMREFELVDTRRVFATPYGATACYERSKNNRMVPGYPGSATEGPGAGNSGWMRTGSNSADITLSLASDAFGHDDMPDAVRVSVASGLGTRDRALIVQSAWDSGDGDYQGYSFTGSGNATAAVWLKGRFHDGCELKFGQGGSYNSVDLAALDSSAWTKVPLSLSSADSVIDQSL
jgi:hypothetical protein